MTTDKTNPQNEKERRELAKNQAKMIKTSDIPKQAKRDILHTLAKALGFIK